MKRLLFLCLGIVLIAAQFGCKGGAQKNGNTAANGNNNLSQVNPAGPNNPNAPIDPNAPGGPLAQDGGPKGKGNPGGETPVSSAPMDSSTLSMASMEFHGALLRGNKEQLTALMADDFKGTLEDGTVQTKAQVLANAKDSGQFYSANVPPAQVKGNTATTTGTITMMSTDPAGGKGAGGGLKFTDTWRKSGDKWLLTATTITKS